MFTWNKFYIPVKSNCNNENTLVKFVADLIAIDDSSLTLIGVQGKIFKHI